MIDGFLYTCREHTLLTYSHTYMLNICSTNFFQFHLVVFYPPKMQLGITANLLFYATTLILVKKSIGNQAEIHSSLRKAVFKGYQRDVKPDGQVEVKAGISIINLDLDPERKVNY